MNLPEVLQGPSLTRLIQGFVAGAVVTLVVGFGWAGWSLASTTQKQIEAAQQASAVRVLAPICADRFQRSADASANLKALNSTDSWKRDEMIEKAGWTKFPGSEPDRQVAEACAKLLSDVKK